MLVVLAGVALAVVGVALNENDIAVGRVLIMAGLPLAIVGLLYALVTRRRGGGSAPEAPADSTPAETSVSEAASRLGLTFEDGRATGTFKARRVAVGGEANEWPVAVRAYMTRELDMGLSVMRGRPPGDARKVVTVGDGTFDSAYVVRADEPERARTILTERLRELLLGGRVHLDDSGVLLQVAPCDAETLVQRIRLAVKVARELDRASTKVPCAAAMSEARESWLTYAQNTKLASNDTPMAMWGQIDGIDVSAMVVRDAFQHYHFELKADFPTPLNRGLELKPASSATQFDRSGEPIGHPAFDKIFMLKARDELDAARLVGPETRDAILELRESGLQLRASDTGLWAWVGFTRTVPDAVPRGLTRMVQLAERIAGNASRFPIGG